MPAGQAGCRGSGSGGQASRYQPAGQPGAAARPAVMPDGTPTVAASGSSSRTRCKGAVRRTAGSPSYAVGGRSENSSGVTVIEATGVVNGRPCGVPEVDHQP